MQAKVLVITGFGLNCEKESAKAFTEAGALADQIHLNDVLADKAMLSNYHILIFIGGFSFGDHLGAGTVFSSPVKHHLGNELKQFIDDGKLVIGICNGFQTLARMGLLPALGGKYFDVQAALAENDSNVFRDDWVYLKANPDSPCVFTKGIDLVQYPIRHGEGKFVTLNDQVLDELESNNQVVLRYANADGSVATSFPANPNGSINSIAGICDPSGRVFGLMPHPEAFLSPYNDPQWTLKRANGDLPKQGLGQAIFVNAVNYVKAELL